MARSKGLRRGGQKNNLNAAKSGFTSWRRRRALPSHLGHVRHLVLKEEADLISDKGGEDNVTAGEIALIRDAGTAQGLILLALEKAVERGAIVETESGWDLAPALKCIKGLIDTRRNNLTAVGLQRRSRDIFPPSVDEIKRRYKGTNEHH